MAVPGIMVDIGANVARMQQDMRRLTGSMESGFSKILNSAKAFGGMFAGYLSLQAVVSLAENSVQAFFEAEKAENHLAIAMRNMGDYTRSAHAALVAYAGELQRVTAIEDDATIGAMATLKTFGMNEEELKKATKAVLDMSVAMGTDLNSAANLIGKAFVGNTSSLSRYGIIVDDTKNAAEKFQAVLDQVQQRFGGFAQAELDTYAGKWKALKNSIGDTAEKIGHMISQVAFGPLEDAQAKVLMAGEKTAIAFQSASFNLKRVITPEAIQALRQEADAWEYLTSRVEKFKPVSEETQTAIERLNNEMLKTNIQIQSIGKGAVQKQIAMLQIERREYEKAGVEKTEIDRLMAQKSALFWKQYFYDKDSAYYKNLIADRSALAEWETPANIENYLSEEKKKAEWAKEIFEKAEKDKTAIAEWETRASADSYIKEWKDTLEWGRQEYERTIAGQKGIAEWETRVDDLHEYLGEIKATWDAEKKIISEREQILLDFADRFRKITLSNADYAIEQIEKQAAIFRQAGADEVALAIWAAKEKQKASREWQDGAIRGLQEYHDNATNAAKGIEELTTRSFENMEDILVDFVKTGKASFKDLVDFILTELMRIAIRKYLLAPVANFISGLGSPGPGMDSGSGLNVKGAGGAWGYAHEGAIIGPQGSFKSAPDALLMSAPRYHAGMIPREVPLPASPKAAWGYAHEGRIIGTTSGMARPLPAAMLLEAPKYHGGLQPDEFPTILKRGEGVFTPEQMKALGGTTAISIAIPINMDGGDTRKAGRIRRSLESELEPVVRPIVERIIREAS